MKRGFFITLLLLLITLPLTMPHNHQSVATVQAQDDLLASVQQHGTVRVMVGLDVAFQPEGELASSQAVADQQAAIQQTQQTLIQRLATYNVRNVRHFETIPFVVMDVDEAALQALASDPSVSSITEDELLQQTLNRSIPLIGGDVAWDKGYTGEGWSIVIIDSGVDSSHEFLQGKVVAEGCFSTNGYPGYPDGTFESICPNGSEQQTGTGSAQPCTFTDSCSHGTHVAGTAAGKGDTFSGVAPDATIIALQVETRVNDQSVCNQMNKDAPCSLMFSSDIARALEYAYQLRYSYDIASVNMSLGGQGYSSQSACDADSPDRKAAIDNLRAAGIPSIVSSGNQGYISEIATPGCISSVFSVGSTHDGSVGTVDQVSSFSNSASFLDFLAPGQLIYSSVPNNGYEYMQGTSMAAPHVAGAWAVMKSKYPSASIELVYNGLSSTGVRVTDYRNGITKPRIQLDAALDTLPTLLNTPTNLQATMNDKTSITLTWDDNNEYEAGFAIVRWYGSSWQLVGTTGKNETTYTDNNDITCEQEYFYRVAAINGDERSEYSEMASVTTPACAAPGDCNEDSTVDAADLSAIALEISQETFQSGGCDANRDDVVDVEDIDCTIAIIFGTACEGPSVSDLMFPHLPDQPMTPGAEILLPTTPPVTAAAYPPAQVENDGETTSPPVAEPNLDLPIIGIDDTDILPDVHDTIALSDTDHITLTGVTIDGELWGSVMTDYTFTADITPTNATLPITYTWIPEPRHGQGSSQATYDWQTPGRRTITISVTQATPIVSDTTTPTSTADVAMAAIRTQAGTTSYTLTTVQATHTITIMQDLYAIGPEQAIISGVSEGYPTQVYTITAAVTPSIMTRPVTYIWTPTPLSGQGTITATYRWMTTGPQTVGFSVTNRAGVISATHTISLAADLHSLVITGTHTPLVDQELLYTATISTPVTLPITYTWTPEPFAGQGQPIASYRWSQGGTETLVVSATNGFDTISASYPITVYNTLKELQITGASSGRVHTFYTFLANREPTQWLIPMSYTWSPEPLYGQGTPLVIYRWSEPTNQPVQVMASSMDGEQVYKTASTPVNIEDVPDGPLMTVPVWQYAAANSTVEVPITFKTDDQDVSSLVFSINYDEDMLLFNPNVADAITFHDSSGLISQKHLFSIADHDGEIDIAITDRSYPLSSLTDNDMLLTIKFQVRTPRTIDSLATIGISTSPSVSFGNTSGASINGNAYGGSIYVASESRPVIGLPPHVEASNGQVTIPVSLLPHEHELGKVQFVLDYDEMQLRLDDSDSNSDGIPDVITMTNGISGSIMLDTNVSDGELAFVLEGNSPYLQQTSGSALQAGDLVNITFDVLGKSNSFGMAVQFSQEDDTSPTFVTLEGKQVEGVVNGGSDAGTLITLAKRFVYMPLVQR